MRLIKSCFLAFSMYSSLPMPTMKWEKDSMKYMLCFFPLVGFVIGLVFILWTKAAMLFEVGKILYAAVCVIIPIALSGAIHMDGFCDTVDALSSRAQTERKLEILKDSHSGAFAVIGCVLYIMLTFALWTEISGWKEILILAIGFILSRSLSGLSVVIFRCAKTSGLAATFYDAALKKQVAFILELYIIICIVIMLYINLLIGAACVLIAIFTFLYYRRMSYRQFGGITGDLAGYFLQICEFNMLLIVLVVQKVVLK
ncbi:MAG: adenosylcobinamide-GDP ribazoletransferase [Clostridiales bacterium]|nr:adenosylcobinamide-GDP ribazoletransferase [Clostridiales bacterium]